MLDLVKCFERVPYAWLVQYAVEFCYPMAVLRLSLAAYAVGAAYLFACDAARYVNHTYLYVLLALVLFSSFLSSIIGKTVIGQ